MTVSVHFGMGLAGNVAALLGAVLLGSAGTLLWVHFDLPHRHSWLPPLVLAVTILVSTLVLELGFRYSFWQLLSPLLAGGASTLTIALRIRDRQRCNLCNRRLKLQSVTFRCPRCSMLVCDENCWNFEHRRCEMCLENRVPVLPVQDSWWSRVTGPRSMNGRCQICLASGDQGDLRPCVTCRRLQCRVCWDFNNGECARCGATLPELPSSLRTMVAEADGREQLLPSHRSPSKA